LRRRRGWEKGRGLSLHPAFAVVRLIRFMRAH
jgi:hypothetical protein